MGASISRTDLEKFCCSFSEMQDGELDMSLRSWAPALQRAIMDETSWMGVQTRKNPLDAWVYQEILYEVQPQVVVEIGSWKGGSTLYFAHLLDILGDGIVVSIDVDRSNFAVEHDRIHALTGSSSDPSIVAMVTELCRDKRVLVCHDGDHRRSQVLADLHACADLVSVGSYIIVEDGIVDFFPRGTSLHPNKIDRGPVAAISTFLASDERFEVDSTRERFLVTWNPRGFLRRVR